MAKQNLLQWVNLDRDKKIFVEDEVKSIERLGPVRFEVTFKKDKAARFRVRVEPVNEPSTYTATEKARNGNFRVRYTKTHTNAGRKKTKITEDIALPAAGGNTYKIQAKFKGQTKETRVVETRRKLYYQPIAMAGIAVPNLSSTESYYESLFLLLKNKGGTGRIDFKQNVQVDDNNETLALIREAKKAYKLKDYEPWAFTAVFVNMLADRQEKEFFPTVAPTHAVRSRILKWGSEVITFTLPPNNYLWYGIEPEDDKKNGGKGIWLVTNSCNFVEPDGKENPIPDANVVIDTSVMRTPRGGYNTLKITIPSHVRNFWSKKTGSIWIKLIVISGFTGGYSEPEINIITVARQAWWRDTPDAKRLQVLNHEMGHKFGMVPEGLGKQLDAGGKLYGGSLNPHADQKEHQGPHCENGATYTLGNDPAWDGVPACVMFGATSCYTSTMGGHVAAPSSFCGLCEPQVKKLDLDGRGLAGFVNSIAKY